MDKDLRASLLAAKHRYEPEGFVILGIFGSRARGDHGPNSDLDILYQLEQGFYDRYRGWEAAGRLEDIRIELESLMGLAVDIANADSLMTVGKKHILPETVYVT